MNWFINYFSDETLITILKALSLCIDMQWLILDKIIVAMITEDLNFSVFTYDEIHIEDEIRRLFQDFDTLDYWFSD